MNFQTDILMLILNSADHEVQNVVVDILPASVLGAMDPVREALHQILTK